MPMTIDQDIIAAFTPTGKLRASINVGNPILANIDPKDGTPKGVSIDLATEFAGRLGVELELVVFKTAGESVKAVASETADIGFFAIDPARGEQISFTPPYIIIEGAYLVRESSPITIMDSVDRAENRVVVGKGSAYDLYLSRELKNAGIFRAASSPAVVDTFLKENLDVAAGVKQQLQADAKRLGGLRLLDGHFMLIRQAMGTPKSRGAAASTCLHDFIEEMKQSGFIASALERHQITGAAIAPMQA